MSARAVAKQVGIESVWSDLAPREKLRVMQDMRNSRNVVVMVGDRINEAPTLAAADIGMSLGTGPDLGLRSASVTLMRADLRDVYSALVLSRRVTNNMCQNLGLALFFNLVTLPFAAGALYPHFGWLMNPMFAGGVMVLGTAAIMANAARLRNARLW